jgi:hypothetical protein
MSIEISDPVVYPSQGVVTPPPEVAQAVRRLVAREGVARAASILGVPRDTLTRLRGGVPLRLGSLLVARRALAAIDPTVRP